MIYLACPYSHKDPEVRRQRFESANAVAAKLMQGGRHVFSPISHTHPIAVAGDLPKGWDYWEQYDRIFLGIAKEFWVIRIDGWRESVGVQAEMRIASELRLPVVFCDAQGEETGAW